MGDGAILARFVTMTSNATAGLFNFYVVSYMVCDSLIDDYVTFGSVLETFKLKIISIFINGISIIQDKPERQLTIVLGKNVGIDATVTKNVPQGMPVFGNPAKPLTKVVSRRE